MRCALRALRAVRPDRTPMRGVLCVVGASAVPPGFARGGRAGLAVPPETFADEFPAVDLLASSMDADVVVHSDYYCTA